MIVEIDKELEDVFPRYLRNREEDLVKMQVALEQNDFDALRHISHKLAGNAAGYGLLDLGKMARRLEEAAMDRKHHECHNEVGQMKAYLNELQPKFV